MAPPAGLHQQRRGEKGLDAALELAEEGEVRRPGLPSALFACGAAAGAAFFYWISQWSLSGLNMSDPAGNGMGAGFAVLGALLSWTCLAGFLAATAWQSGIGRAALAAIWVFGAAAAYASVDTIVLLDEQEGRPGALRLVPGTLPWLVVLAGLWLRASRDVAARKRHFVLIELAFLAAVLLAISFSARWTWEAGAPERRAAQEAAYQAALREQARTESARRARLAALGPDDPLDPYFDYVGEDDPALFARIRAVRSRQADVERLIAGGVELYAFRRLSEFGVTATPELCSAYRARIDGELAPHLIEEELPNLRWFVGEGCDLRPTLTRLRNQVRQLPGDHFARNCLGALQALLAQADPGDG